MLETKLLLKNIYKERVATTRNYGVTRQAADLSVFQCTLSPSLPPYVFDILMCLQRRRQRAGRPGI